MNEITVVITCYAEKTLLYDAINSLQNQTDKNFEIVLVNDASPYEETNLACAQVTSKNNRINYIRNSKNLGLSGARNIGVDNATGQIIIPLDADDILPPDTIKLIRNKFIEKPEADFIFGNYVIHYTGAKIKKVRDCSVLANNKGLLSPYSLANDWQLLGTSPFKKMLWKKLGGYDLQFTNSCQDVDFWQRALLMNAKGYYINHTIYQWNRSNKGLNSNPNREKIFMSVYLKNFDFSLEYRNNYKYALRIAIKLNDENAVKKWVRFHLKRKNMNLLVLMIWIMPKRLLLRIRQSLRTD